MIHLYCARIIAVLALAFFSLRCVLGATPGDTFVELTQGRISAIADMLPASAKGFGPTYHDRAAFAALSANPAFAKVIPQAERLLSEPFPPWSDDAYLDFSRTGQRPAGEKMLSARSDWLNTLVWAECLENRGRFVPTINMVLHELASQRSWTLPAHDDKLTSFNGTGYFVELNSAGLAANLAQSLYMLDDKVDPNVRREVLSALDQRVFKPMLSSYETGAGHWWLTGTNNWNAVCLAGVTGAALTIVPDVHERAVFAAAGEHYINNFVSGYSGDGYCNEGLGYYNYGYGHFMLLREQLLQATSGKLDLFSIPKIKNMAMFGPHIEIINGISPSIGDCRFGTKIDPMVLWYNSRVLGLGLERYDNLDFVKPGAPALSAMLSFPNSASESAPSKTVAAGAGLRSYFSDAGVLICRPAVGGNFGVCLAGGNNDKSHNHNDIGSFSIVVGDQMPIGDPGGPYVYTKDTFGPLRYTKFEIFRSRNHPVPLVEGVEQKAGKQSVAKILLAKFSDIQDEFDMDIASAYPAPDLTKLVRSFTYDRTGAGSLVVRDDYAFKSPQSFEIGLTTHGAWKQLDANTLEFTLEGQSVEARVSAPGPWTADAVTVVDNAPPFTRVGVKLNDPSQSGAVIVTYTPVEQVLPSPAPKSTP